MFCKRFSTTADELHSGGQLRLQFP